MSEEAPAPQEDKTSVTPAPVEGAVSEPEHESQPLSQAELDAEEDARAAEDDPSSHPDYEHGKRNEMV